MGVDYGARKRAKKRRKHQNAEGVSAEAGVKARKQRRGTRRLCQGMCFKEPTLTAEDKEWNDSDGDNDSDGHEQVVEFEEAPTPTPAKKQKRSVEESTPTDNSRAKKQKTVKPSTATPKYSTGTNLLDPTAALSSPVQSTDLDPTSFNAFHDLIQKYAASQKLPQPTHIQQHCWQPLCEGKHVQGVAPPGSGKTLAYLLPAAVKLQKSGQSGSTTPTGPLVLIITPTRELAIQVAGECRGLKRLGGWRHVCIHGGVSKEPQVSALSEAPHILVATPGRLLDLVDDGAVQLNEVVYVVLDEADKMLSLGFKPQLDRVRDLLGLLRAAPASDATIKKKKKKPVAKDGQEDVAVTGPQVVLFTATLPPEVQHVADLWLGGGAVKVQTEKETLVSTSITQVVHVCAEHKKPDKLLKHMNSIKEASKDAGMRNLPRVLIFANKVKTVRFVHDIVEKEGYRAVMVHGARSQAEREEAIVHFRSGKAQVLVATDVAGRGLDIRNLPYVVNYDFPSSLDSYVHRIGRTGRLAAKGHSYSFFTRNLANLAPALVQLLTQHEQAVDPNLVALAEAWKIAAQKLGIDPMNPTSQAGKLPSEEDNSHDQDEDEREDEEAMLNEMAPDRLEGLGGALGSQGIVSNGGNKRRKLATTLHEQEGEGMFQNGVDEAEGDGPGELESPDEEAAGGSRKKLKGKQKGLKVVDEEALQPVVSMVEKMLSRKMQRAAEKQVKGGGGNKGKGEGGLRGADGSAGKERQSAEKNVDFIASKKFTGAKAGFVFKLGERGLGYYKDKPPVVKKQKKSSGGPIVGGGTGGSLLFGKKGGLIGMDSDSDSEVWEKLRGLGNADSASKSEKKKTGVKKTVAGRKQDAVRQVVPESSDDDDDDRSSGKRRKALPGRLRKKLAKQKAAAGK